ncbi:hypothetical protein BHE74_00017783 [Ensete ventricosum]|nr:hypothetical protein GW17_00055499 [Ensete ventricosum]RWW74288.1 hypothetical protein BHE74_00017783 [Ensete ventricosum]
MLTGVVSSSLRCCHTAAALLLSRCDAAAMLPLHCFVIAILQWHRLFAAVMLLLPFDAAAASKVLLHFFSFSFSFFFFPSFRLPPLFVHWTFLFNLFFFLLKASVRTTMFRYFLSLVVTHPLQNLTSHLDDLTSHPHLNLLTTIRL